ncbi:hypothetical protein SAMN02745166_02947 [Prosthecobacter debontii]|uniref:N-formylglutamate amidohydrolase n=1 Tax=Prosthecobacter debontii TaxID=48467 RepID=A0A1T4YDR8_9BACT|nr:N-formylglutamate amidohydrolase [Prosthecobacter debontii]SKA99461.1 hypothetical protein SAMN02745166_02947 [Prosthecobacter debontii]
MRGKIPLRCLVLLGMWTLQAAGQTPDVSNYIESSPGTLPIILTAPHGGDLKPASLLTRRYGVTAKDSNTRELSLLIAQELEKRYGGRPHLVICRLHRSKLDCNRELTEAAQGDPTAIAAWQRFHAEAEAQEKAVIQRHGTGLTLDIHGHRHEDPRVELGYLLTSKLLNTVSDAQLDRDAHYRTLTSLRTLSGQTPHRFSDLIRGPSSLGALLEAKGFHCLPSPSKPSPGQAAYFSGAYDITAHGSRDDAGPISAIQLECPWEGVRDTPAHQRRFAQALAECLGTYFETHFQRPLSASFKSSDIGQ